jgi:type VI secretion system protein ImpE
MNPQELLRAGKLNEAIQSLGAEVREDPSDKRRRTFLFELLCFAGEFDRASKHLNVLAQDGVDAETGALLYRSALAAERKRQIFFDNGAGSDRVGTPFTLSGKINGRRFSSLADADPRIGSRLEIFVAGEYIWLPFEHISSLTMETPRYLRDLLWATGHLVAGPAAKGQEFGEVLLPVLCPNSFRDSSDAVKLGRTTEWQLLEGGVEAPIGQKLLLVDGEDVVPFLEVRELTFDLPADGQSASA